VYVHFIGIKELIDCGNSRCARLQNMLTPIQVWPIIATFLYILSLKSATTEYVFS